MKQKRTRDEDTQNLKSRMEPAEGSRDTVNVDQNSGGISNRPLEEEQQRQQRLPNRGHSQEPER
jgi:hypothetical protein